MIKSGLKGCNIDVKLILNIQMALNFRTSIMRHERRIFKDLKETHLEKNQCSNATFKLLAKQTHELSTYRLDSDLGRSPAETNTPWKMKSNCNTCTRELFWICFVLLKKMPEISFARISSFCFKRKIAVVTYVPLLLSPFSLCTMLKWNVNIFSVKKNSC